MTPIVKYLAALLLVVPLGAYAAGSLAASSADSPEPRDTIVIRKAPGEDRFGPRTQPTASPTRSAGVRLDPDDVDDSSDDWGRDDDEVFDDHGGDRSEDARPDDDPTTAAPDDDRSTSPDISGSNSGSGSDNSGPGSTNSGPGSSTSGSGDGGSDDHSGSGGGGDDG